MTAEKLAVQGKLPDGPVAHQPLSSLKALFGPKVENTNDAACAGPAANAIAKVSANAAIKPGIFMHVIAPCVDSISKGRKAPTRWPRLRDEKKLIYRSA